MLLFARRGAVPWQAVSVLVAVVLAAFVPHVETPKRECSPRVAECVDNRVDDRLDNRVDDRLDNRVDDRLDDRVDVSVSGRARRGGQELNNNNMAETRARAAARGWVTRARKKLEAELAVVPVDSEALADAATEFDLRLGKLDTIQSEYEMLLEDDELEADIKEAADFRDNARMLRIQAAKILQSAGMSKSQKCVKLPKFELPKFSGNVLEWQSFWDKFEASIHSSDLPDINKFTYLQSYLEGEAKAAVQGLSVTADHYQLAVNILKKRFGRKGRIIFAHVQSLLNLSLTQNKSSVAALWQLKDELTAHVRSLEQLGVDGTQYGIILTPLVLSRLPHDIRMEWAREGEERESDLEWLLHFLNTEISCRERSSMVLKQKYDNSGTTGTAASNNSVKKSQSGGSATSLVSYSSKDSGVVCVFCEGKHAADRCSEARKLSHAERQERVQKSPLCFRCLKTGHRAIGCVATCQNCSGRHHAILCSYKSPAVAGGNHRTSQNNNGTHTSHTNTATITQQGAEQSHCDARSTGSSSRNARQVLLQCAKVNIADHNGVVQQAVVMFDSGSDKSYVSGSLVQKLCPTFVEQQNVAFAAFGSEYPSRHELRNVFSINFVNGHDILATEIPVITAPIFKPKVPGDILQSFGDLDWACADFYDDTEHVTVDILIGLDAYWKLIMPGILKADNDGLVAQQTVFGWILSGIVSATGDGNDQSAVTSTQLLCLNDLSDEHLKALWDLDTIGIKETSESLMMDPVHSKFLETVSFENSRYQVELPFNDNASRLLDNVKQAHARLNILNKKLEKDPPLKQRYSDVFSELESLGIIEEVPEIDIQRQSADNSTFYMPHRPIVKEDRVSTKVRPVFDASAKGYNKVSLNDCMEAGPNMIPNLPEILIRFRRWKIAFTADITKAFLQINVVPEHRDVHRFLLQESDKIRIMRFVRLPFGNKSSPFLLNATIQHHLSKYDETPVIKEMKDNFYMDDLMTGCDYEDEVCEMTVEAKTVMADASMCLTKCNSNSKQVYETVNRVFQENSQTAESIKVLGMRWFASIDCFSFDGINIPGDVIVTKRMVLSCIARLFDPLGVCTPFVMTAKILFQDIWRLGLSWDEVAPPEISILFENWCQQLTIVKQWQISRSYTGFPWSEIESMNIHGFGDASTKAYGACVYLVATHRDTGLVTSSLVFAKSRVAPLKTLTLPRMELLSALLCARLVKFVHKALRLPDEVQCSCWSDSTVALAWIKGNPFRWKTFVSNRVIEIQQLTNPDSWKHCPGKMNPADLVTRGISAADLVQSSLWGEGPDFIRENTGFSVVESDESICDDTVKSEMKKSVSTVTKTSTTVSPHVSPVLDIPRWGTFEKCLRVVAWVFRFIHNAQCNMINGDLTYDELTDAKIFLFIYVQTVEYSKEFEALKAGHSVSKGSAICKLSPFVDQQGLLRLGGRLQSTSLTYSEKHPVILPKGHLSLLLIRFQHVLMKHAGVENMLVTLRNTVWIVGARRLAKKVKSECVHCQRVDAKPLAPPMPPLPELRVKQAPPFSVVGLDFGGPLYCSDYPRKKYYILLFTCAVIRAVHLELTESLNVQDFAMAFRKFVSRRGMPTTIYSDNAKTFKAFKTKFLSTYGSTGPSWKFIVPRAPWWGGFWERMIGSVKSALKKTVGLKSLSKNELETTLIEIEACVNSRPLTFVGDEADSHRPITPTNFLTGRTSNFDQTEGCEGPVNMSSQDLADKLKLQSVVLDEFWEVWSQNYIRNLPSYQGACKSKSGTNDDLQEGSYVMIREDNTSRLAWPVGIVSRVIPGRDHVIRAAEIKTKTGVYARPVQRLHKIELIADVVNKSDENASSVDGPGSSVAGNPTDTIGDLPSGEISSGTNGVPKSDESAGKPVVRTRYGRVSKPVVKLDL